MKIFPLFLFAILFGAMGPISAQTADEIIDTYFENTGGKDNWRKLEGMQLEGSMKMQGMDIGLNVVSLKDKRQYTEIKFQGQEMKQAVYDGEIMWGMNFMTGKPEQMDAELLNNFKANEANDFPDALLDYKDKGYSVEYLGKETMEGTECFKVKLTKNPVMVNGKQEDAVTIYYFDTENYVPIAEEMSGSSMQGPPGAPTTMISTLSDYQEVEGFYFPFTRSTPQGDMVMEKITINPTVEEGAFKMPEVAVEEKK